MVSPSDSYTFDLRKMSGYQLDSECPLMIDTPQTVTIRETDPYWVLKINCGVSYQKNSQFDMNDSRHISEIAKPIGYLFVKKRNENQTFGSLDKEIAPYAVSTGANNAEIIQHHPLESDRVTVIELYRGMKGGFISEQEEP